MFGPQVHECNKIYPGDFLDVSLVTLSYGMGQYIGAYLQQPEREDNPDEKVSTGGCGGTLLPVKPG